MIAVGNPELNSTYYWTNVGDRIAMVFKYDSLPSITVLMTMDEYARFILDSREAAARCEARDPSLLTSLEALLEPRAP